MAMNKNERLQIADLLRQGFTESRKSDAGNMAVFYDAHNMMVYAGIIQEWPLIIATDIEWGKVEVKDTTQEPFAGKTVKFFSPFERRDNPSKKSPFVH